MIDGNLEEEEDISTQVKFHFLQLKMFPKELLETELHHVEFPFFSLTDELELKLLRPGCLRFTGFFLQVEGVSDKMRRLWWCIPSKDRCPILSTCEFRQAHRATTHLSPELDWSPSSSFKIGMFQDLSIARSLPICSHCP